MSDLRYALLQLQDDAMILHRLLQAANAMAGRDGHLSLLVNVLEESEQLAGKLNDALDTTSLPDA